MITPAIAAIGIAVVAALAFGGGWGVNHWKNGAEIERLNSDKSELESDNAILIAANGECATDIEGVRKGVAIIMAQTEEREIAASEAMKAADVKISQRRIRSIRELPSVAPAPEAQCSAIVQEQIDYVQARKSADE